MKLSERLEDSTDRFRLAESCVGLAGCLCVCYAVWTPCWLAGGGLWMEQNHTGQPQTEEASAEGLLFRAQEAQQVFGFLSSLMAVSSAVLCLVFALCWSSRTVHSYSNTRSLLMAGQTLYPTTLLLLTLVPTGFFFLLSWALFTRQYQEEIQHDLSALGSSYWLGALGWALLLVVQPVVFLVEQVVVPDPLPDLLRCVLSPQNAAPVSRSHSEPSTDARRAGHFKPRRAVSVA
ncbi:unnamed protein product [Gadus morhua 'NCC']